MTGFIGNSQGFRPVSAPSNRNLSVSKAYLKKAAKEKRARERDFAMELFQEKADFERKGQANKLMRRHNILKVYSQTKNRDNFLQVKVVEGPDQHERVMTADAFHILFHMLSIVSSPHHLALPDYNNGTSSSAKHAKLRMQSKKDIQDGLRLVLKSTIELTAILEEQLYELQRKGWNCTASHAVGPHIDT
ncbi:hypothetical protein H310_08092 [Aphanomyces invadans]|uniref:Uncharacterized protein n=1 Tax=Aphanomyces invadans TaxID=157072 RepID=A0A024TZ24_9STRA|nr:hypothetical protein H310_08092 [Aphanomyces invadans]ETV99385.1 hypothetical protein H310_08092 [Aphanomyces invadans]|eukprot:XP_008871941.1 hypothetical protein H310_08092 [Aphanomyces invadans]